MDEYTPYEIAAFRASQRGAEPDDTDLDACRVCGEPAEEESDYCADCAEVFIDRKGVNS